MEDLCAGHPSEFKTFMEYCRGLKFDEDPDYPYILNLFEQCMHNNGIDPRSTDYTWKQNRLSKDKEALKKSLMDVIKKKPKVVAKGQEGATAKPDKP